MGKLKPNYEPSASRKHYQNYTRVRAVGNTMLANHFYGIRIKSIFNGYTDYSHLDKLPRLQNSPYFCVFKYARAVKQKVWNEAENRERDWGEKRVRLASFARVRLIHHALPISLLIL